MSTVLEAPARLGTEELMWLEEVIEVAPQEIQNSFHTAKEYYNGRIKDLCREGVADAAAFLDEHVIGWAGRVTRPINMNSVHDCVLGQVFDPNHPDNQKPVGGRRFGILPPKRPTRRYSNGFMAGAVFLDGRGYVDRPFVFSSYEAMPYWNAEIDKRKDAQ